MAMGDSGQLPLPSDEETLLLSLWARIEAAVRLANRTTLPDWEGVLRDPPQLFERALLVTPKFAFDTFQRPRPFEVLSDSDVFIRWANVFKEEIDVVHRTRNAVVHAVSVSSEDIKGAILTAARLLAYLHYGFGDSELKTDPIIKEAFAVVGVEPPDPPR